MIIIGVSDIHCSYGYSSKLVLKAIQLNADLILVAGDIECEHPLEEIISSGIRTYCVTGNLDDIYIYRILKNYEVRIEGSIEVFNGYYIAGIGAIGFSTNLSKVKELITDKGIDPRKLIILSHYPPYGFNDTTYSGLHAGNIELRNFIEEYEPLLFLHGHIHEARGVSRYKNTLIVNPGPLMHGYYSVIKLNGDNVEARLERL